MNDLVNQLNTDNACQDAAKQFVFDKVTYGGLWGFFEHAIDRTEFTQYIQTRPRFLHGLKSTLPYRDAQCGEVLTCGVTGDPVPSTIKQHFAPPSTATAMTVSPSRPLKIFWRSLYAPPGAPTDEGFGLGVDPSNNCVNIYNESILLHEALHGLTGWGDRELSSVARLHLPEPSLNISIYVKNNVLTKCPTFR